MAKAAPKPPTKTEIYANIAEATGLTKKQVGEVFDALDAQINKSLTGRGAPKMFAIPGLCKITVQHKPATKEHSAKTVSLSGRTLCLTITVTGWLDSLGQSFPKTMVGM